MRVSSIELSASRQWWQAASVVALGIVGSLAVAAVMGTLWSPPTLEYSQIAQSLRAGAGAAYPYLGATYYFYGSPIYPLLLSWSPIWHHPALGVVANALAHGLSALVIYLLARRLFGHRLALGATLLAALHPGNLLYVGKLHPQALDVLLIVTAFWLVAGLGLTTIPPSPPIRSASRGEAERSLGGGRLLSLLRVGGMRRCAAAPRGALTKVPRACPWGSTSPASTGPGRCGNTLARVLPPPSDRNAARASASATDS